MAQSHGSLIRFCDRSILQIKQRDFIGHQICKYKYHATYASLWNIRDNVVEVYIRRSINQDSIYWGNVRQIKNPHHLIDLASISKRFDRQNWMELCIESCKFLLSFERVENQRNKITCINVSDVCRIMKGNKFASNLNTVIPKRKLCSPSDKILAD